MAFVARRGGFQQIEEDELRAYLGSVLRLENLGLLMGAGTSCPAGGMTVKGLWGHFLATYKDSAEWLLAQGFVTASAMAPHEADRVPPNVEELLDSLEVAHREWTRVLNTDLLALEAAKDDLYRALVAAAVLSDELWEQDTGPSKKLSLHRALLQKVVACREPGQAAPWTFTTNYDLAIEWSAESIGLQVINGFLGLHNRTFSPQSFDLGFRNVQARGEARFGVYNIYLAKLHGSLSWHETPDEDVFEIPASSAWDRIKAFRDDKTKPLGLMVVPGAAKYLHTVGFTLGELLRRFAEFLARPQTCLITCGYSFGDSHINRLLRSALLNPTLQLVIYLPEFNGSDVDGIHPEAAQLIALNNPRVTVVGGGDGAWLNKLVEHLPEPSLYDQTLIELREAIKKSKATPTPPTGGGAKVVVA